jgi:hypothetical protein
MPRKKPATADPAPVRFTQLTAPIVPGYTICNLSEDDIRDLHAGRVPDWIIRTTDLFLDGLQGPAAVVAGMRASAHQQQEEDRHGNEA